MLYSPFLLFSFLWKRKPENSKNYQTAKVVKTIYNIKTNFDLNIVLFYLDVDVQVLNLIVQAYNDSIWQIKV